MKTRLAKWTLLLVVLAMTVCAICAVFIRKWPKWLTLEDEQEIKQEEKTYHIDSSSLLRSLAQGREDAFILKMTTPEATTQWTGTSVFWGQADYYFIAQSFFQLALDDSLDGWKLKEIFFNLDCKDYFDGFQSGSFRFFRSEHLRDRDSRVMRYVYISPYESEVYFAEVEFYPELKQWESLDLGQMKISAESALQIAENAGGTEFRKEVDNNCDISERIEAGGRYEGWWVWYSSRDMNLDFKIVIDSLTSEYKVIR
jgi:hypothetical protein